jgi:glycosyltransferase involved in cell wall biosynthesis
MDDAAHEDSFLRVGLLTGCQDRHYAFGLAMALAASDVSVDVIGSDEIDSPEFHGAPNVRFLNFRRGDHSAASPLQKVIRLVGYYAKLIVYAARPGPQILHILWNYKLEYFDRTVLMLFYRAMGKKVVLTAHNVNQARRDLRDSWLNRTTLKIQYRLCSHIFVHTEKMKIELCCEFGVAEARVTTIRYPMNNAFPDTSLTTSQAKSRLGVASGDKVVLFFGRLVPYKGIEYLLSAFPLLASRECDDYRLVIAGEPKKGAESYLREIERAVGENVESGRVILRTEFIPDEDIEVYLKGADVLVLPYKQIFQSGILIMAYSFGLPVVATDVGSFREDIIEGETGFLCEPEDPDSLAKAIQRYFASDLYRDLEVRRNALREYVNANHSWRAVAGLTVGAYRMIVA